MYFMIPKILCPIHEEAIETIDLTQTNNGSRIYCAVCLEEKTKKLEETCFIEKIPFLVNEFQIKKLEEINNDYDFQLQKLSRFIKILITHKERVMEIYNELIYTAENLKNKVLGSREEEKNNYSNLLENLNRERLQTIAEVLSGNFLFKSNSQEVRDNFDIFDQQVESTIKHSIEMQSYKIQEYHLILKRHLIKKAEIQNSCQVLACNEEQNLYVGGLGETMIIWKKIGVEFQEKQIINNNKSFIGRLSLGKSIIKLKYENISALVIWQTGQYIVSGHSDQSLKLFMKTDDFWECQKVFQDHKGGITNLKLTKNDENLISTSQDQTIKIWILQKNNLKCIQTLQHHTTSVNFIALSQNSDIMVSSSSETYFNLFYYKKEWKLIFKHQTEGKINRVHINQEQLICQQVNPPKLIFYQMTQKDKSLSIIQEINLNIADSSIVYLQILQFEDSIFCKNENEMLLIRKQRQGKYEIDQIISGSFICGIVCKKCLILGTNQQIEIYEQY